MTTQLIRWLINGWIRREYTMALPAFVPQLHFELMTILATSVQILDILDLVQTVYTEPTTNQPTNQDNN